MEPIIGKSKTSMKVLEVYPDGSQDRIKFVRKYEKYLLIINTVLLGLKESSMPDSVKYQVYRNTCNFVMLDIKYNWNLPIVIEPEKARNWMLRLVRDKANKIRSGKDINTWKRSQDGGTRSSRISKIRYMAQMQVLKRLRAKETKFPIGYITLKEIDNLILELESRND